MFEGSHTAKLIVDPGDGRIVDANAAAARLYHLAAAQLRGMGLAQLSAQPESELTAEMQAAAVAEMTSYECPHRRADGTTVDVEVHSGPIAMGGRSLVLMTVHDVTVRRRLQQQLERQRLRAVQVDRLHALGDMATGIAHELNQPLNGIRAFAEGVLLGPQVGWTPTPAETREALQDIVRQVDRITEVIDHLRVFSRDQSQSDPVPFPVAEAIEGALMLIGAELRAHRIAVHQQVAPELPHCHGWPHAIEQVVLHLLTNARDALDQRQQQQAPDRGGATAPGWHPEVSIRVSRGRGGQHLELEIGDNGGGIPADVVGRVFEPFFTTKDTGKGAGIGLAIVRGIIDRHQGRLEVHNRPGLGVSFTICLPIASAAD